KLADGAPVLSHCASVRVGAAVVLRQRVAEVDQPPDTFLPGRRREVGDGCRSCLGAGYLGCPVPTAVVDPAAPAHPWRSHRSPPVPQAPHMPLWTRPVGCGFMACP